MHQAYHIKITKEALQALFGPVAMQVIIQGNLEQDKLRGQIGHPEFHFDDNRFNESRQYMERQRQMTLDSLAAGQLEAAWCAFGKLTHAGQDFYAHSNYVRLWIAQHPGLPPEHIDALDPDLLDSPDLQSGRVYIQELLSCLPGLQRIMLARLPVDAHFFMNLDAPQKGERDSKTSPFFYAARAALQRTRYEHELTCEKIEARLGSDSLRRFHALE